MSKISKQIDLILNNDTVTVKDKLFLYRNDFGLQFKFNIKENKYLFDNNTYISEFENCKASVTFVKPSGEAFYINTAIVENGLLVFEFTKDMVDEVQEVGFYKIQFHLFNKDRSARVTIPAFEIEVRDLIGVESSKDNQPIVGIAEVGRAKLVATQDNYRISLFSIDEDGYIKTYWENGDIITKDKLNNIEEGISNLYSKGLNNISIENSEIKIKNENGEYDPLKFDASDIEMSNGNNIEEEISFLYSKLDELSYKPITITSFNISKSQAELGELVKSITLSWSYSKNPKEQKLNNVIIPIDIRQSTENNISSNKTFTLQVSDGKTTVSRNASITFMNAKYYGTSSTTNITNDLIKSFSKTLTTSRNGSWTVTANENEYIYFAIPNRFGEPSFYVGGFEGGFFKADVIDFTNSSGYTESYSVYRSTNHSLGRTTVEVK